MNNKRIASLLMTVFILVLMLAGCQNTAQTTGTMGTTGASGTSETTASSGSPVVFQLVASNYKFSQTTIVVKKGDLVRIELTIDEGMHTWVVDEFNARTEQKEAGSSTSVEFVADKAGTFEFYCSVSTHRAMGMVGSLIVEES